MAFEYHLKGKIKQTAPGDVINRSENKSLVFPESVETSLITIDRGLVEPAMIEVLTTLAQDSVGLEIEIFGTVHNESGHKYVTQEIKLGSNPDVNPIFKFAVYAYNPKDSLSFPSLERNT